MNRRLQNAFSAKLVVAVAASMMLIIACGSSDEDTAVTRAKLSEKCYLDSECNSPLRCAFQKCHTQCEESRDCAEFGPTARCIIADRPFNVCQFPEEKVCSYNSDCPKGQRCASDRECRDECKSNIDCVKGQVCATGVCAETTELVNGTLKPPTNGDPIPNSGQSCSLNSDCTQPLRCRAGVCAIECKADVDCENKPNTKCNKEGVCELVLPGGSTCVPTDCKSQGKTCGTITDGCGGTIQCGANDGKPECPAAQTCGGGGANKCGTSICVPKSCAQLGDDCGLVDDECSGVLNCGVCPTGSTCGGAGTKNKCGCVADNVAACKGKQCGTVTNNCGKAVDCGTCAAGTTCGIETPNQCGCKKSTCAGLGLQCGSAPDGCGGTVVCSACPAGQVCGGGGTPNSCGGNACVPTTCAAAGKNCGTISNGCDASLDCGTCNVPGEKCGGAGTANVCGCTKTTCDILGKNCGSVSDGCGGTLSCGNCVSPSVCGGGGVTNVCGCVKTTCAAQGKDCGSIADGCGGTISCGSCGGTKICGAQGVANVCADPGAVKSCVGQAKTCGPNANDDCCRNETVVGTVAGEVFYRRYTSVPPPGAQAPVPQYPEKISSHKLDVYEVTNGRFRTFLQAATTWAYNVSPPPANAGSHSNITTTIPSTSSVGTGWQSAWNSNLPADYNAYTTALQACSNSWTAAPAGGEDRPIECVTWYEAEAFCAWDGGRLPTWGEWQYAYNGGTEYRRYPWGSASPTCNHDSEYSCPWPQRAGQQPLGAGKWGQYNLAGSVVEWTFDTINPPQTPDCSAADCAYRAQYNAEYMTLMGGGHAIAGGWPDQYGVNYSYYEGPFPSANYYNQRTSRQAGVGFRCARNL